MIATEPFGGTGHASTRTIFGAAALAECSTAEADRALELLLEYGVNHIDTAASYGDSELHIGRWLAREPGRFFVATKTEQRTYAEAREQIRRSLDRLGVAQVDLIQLHNLVHPADWDVALGPGGALEAAVEAREEGLVQAIGVTGHGATVAEMHRRSLERFAFDSVLLPYNYVATQESPYAADFEALVGVCSERGVAVQTIKSLALGPWAKAARSASTWYEPLEAQGDVDLAVHWVLGRPGFFLNTVGDVRLLARVLDAAARVDSRPSDETMRELVERRSMSTLFV